jgi:quinol monooxygenase YgiN
MFCVLYEFTVDQSQQSQFKNLWHQLTIRIRDESGSMGSRLHKVIDDDITWIAYAVWPSKNIYDQTPEKVSYDDIRQLFLQTCSQIKILSQMECVDNLLVAHH